MRSFDREPHQTRPILIETDYTQNADGSVLICMGNTKVICTAFLEERVPPFLRNQRRGWVTAEYGMLPGSTHTRSVREASRGKPAGRSVEISRLIGRALRACMNFEYMGERTVTVDCDVIQADGGTRTASITGGYLALAICLWKYKDKFKKIPLTDSVSAISLGILRGGVMVDLDYGEDFAAEVDLNMVVNREGRFVEIQGTAEENPFSYEDMLEILDKGRVALAEIWKKQRQALLDYGISESWLT